MGRHSTPGGSGRTRALVIASVAVVIAVTAGMMAWGSGVFSGGTSGTTSADATSAGPTAAPCPQPAPLVVVADPSIAPALRTVAEKMDAAPGACVRTTIRSETSATTSAALARGAGIDVDAWVPQSGVWAQRTALAARSLGAPAPQLQSLGVLASSPVVLAARTNSANVNADARPGWAAIAGPGVPALVPDPTESAVSLAALLAMRGTLPPGDPRAFPAAVIELGRNIPASADAAFATAAAGDQLVVSTEQALLGRPGFRAVYPAGGTVAVQYPMLRTAAADPGRDDRLAALRAAIVAARPVMAEAGFRDPTGGGELDAPGVSAAAVPATPVTDDAAQLDILRAWGVLTLRSRILSVIDVSGSMLQPAGGGLRRIDVFQRAAGGVIQRFPGDSEIGVWIFSTDRGGGRDWEDLVPVAPLKDPAHVQQINQVVQSLPGRVRGGTALYDTTLAAVRRMRETYDPTKVNSVLLITDGFNDDRRSIDLPTLLADLKRENDPAKPVPVLLIGFGPDTDLDAMRQIADATGGAAYTAREPADLGQVLVDALVQRSCRPNC